MTTSQRIAINGASQQSAVIPSTRAKVVSDVPFYYAVDSSPVAVPGEANTRLANPGKNDINMLGSVTNKIAILGAGTAGNCTVTAIGTVSATTL